MGDRLATIDMGRNEGAAVPLSGRELGPIWHTMWPETRSKWHTDPSSRLATIHRPKLGGAVPPFWGSRVPI